jgi:hypothetical protein
MRRGRFILTAISTLIFSTFPKTFCSTIQNIQKGFRIKSGESRVGKHLKMKGRFRKISTLRSQAHWLVTQKANPRPKPAKELAYPNARQTETM